MRKPSQRARGLKPKLHVKYPIYEKLKDTDSVQFGDFWAPDGVDINLLKSEATRVSEGDLGQLVKDRLKISCGGNFWRYSHMGKAGYIPVPARKAS